MNIQALGGAVCILLTSGAWAAPDCSFQPSCPMEGQQVVLTSVQLPGSGPTFSVTLSTELQDERVLKIVYLATPMFYPGGPPQRTDVALPTLAAGDYVITTFYRIDHGGGMLTPETFAGMIELRVAALASGAAPASAGSAAAGRAPRSRRHEVQAYGPGELRHHPLGRDLRRSVAFLEEAMMRSPRREPG